MKNILLILEIPLEFNLARMILFKLGFNVISLKKGLDMRALLSENFPDLVITSVVGKQDAILEEFLKIRDKRGIPKFIWVGPDIKMKKLSDVQLKVIDATLQRPLQPEQLIHSVCSLLDLSADSHISEYRKMVSESVTINTQPPVPVSNRSKIYDQSLKNIEVVDKVFSLKELTSRNNKQAGKENTEELSAQKKEFLKKLFKTK